MDRKRTKGARATSPAPDLDPPALMAARGLIERATNSTALEVDPRLLKAIKAAVRYADGEARDAAQALMDQMKKQHSQVRYLAVLIIDELFMRSKLFRSLLIVNFDQFLSLSVGFRRNLPLPPPSAIAFALRSKSIELLEKWNASFGVHYRQLRLGFDYLKNTLRFQFPNRIENANRLQQERREREIRSKQILLNKYEIFKESYPSRKEEIQSTIDEIRECLEILHTKEDESVGDIPDDDDEEEFRSLALQQIRLDSLKEGEKVKESSENKPIFDALRELQRLLVSKHLPSVQEWISILVRVDLTDNNFRDTALKELIDLRNHILSTKYRCGQLGCVFYDKEQEDLWEEGKIETDVEEGSNVPDGLSKESLDIVTTKKAKEPTPACNSKSAVCDGSSSKSERSKLLAEAPMITWGPFLDNWGASRDVFANQRGLELEGHWGRVDFDAVIPAEKIAELNVHRTVYKEQPVEIQPCHAPLKRGGLCQRRDLKICPFHGPIISRDADGNPVEQIHNESEKRNEPAVEATEAVSGSIDLGRDLELDKLTIEQLAKQAVKNVRERARDVKATKRAKLAKVREHNEAVLRDAAVASTSYSAAFAEHQEASYGNWGGIKVKTPTLASMLRKNVTAKDRISKRLLSARASETSNEQLIQEENSKYREAFPNQW